MSMYVEGTSTVAVSDIDGVFAISVPLEEAEKKLVISSKGLIILNKRPLRFKGIKLKSSYYNLLSSIWILQLFGHLKKFSMMLCPN